MESKLPLFALLSLIILFSIGLVSADCEVRYYSATGLPIQFMKVDVINISTAAVISTNYSDGSGVFAYVGECSGVRFFATYPSSNYSATLGNGSISSYVNIEDYVTAQVRLSNTLGAALEAQDCSTVVAYNGSLLYDYQTLCSQGKPYLDTEGNWVAPTNCPRTDSNGWYYFRGKVGADMGYYYGRTYQLIFTCNGKAYSQDFTIELPKKLIDLNVWEGMITKQGGMMLFYLLVFLGVLIIISLIMLAIRKKKLFADHD
jgi:hypothetical protein